jgi:hypothetical protein
VCAPVELGAVDRIPIMAVLWTLELAGLGVAVFLARIHNVVKSEIKDGISIYLFTSASLFLEAVIGCVTAMKIRLRTLLHSRRSTVYAVGSYANSMKGVTCDTSAS